MSLLAEQIKNQVKRGVEEISTKDVEVTKVSLADYIKDSYEKESLVRASHEIRFGESGLTDIDVDGRIGILLMHDLESNLDKYSTSLRQKALYSAKYEKIFLVPVDNPSRYTLKELKGRVSRDEAEKIPAEVIDLKEKEFFTISRIIYLIVILSIIVYIVLIIL
ncbi:MAG: hypothetical protein U9M95_04720 [Candidatus Altiarchaeota archaeon]|nr:hypothetical protein [Candidatus Altiarchaeota archaeon]